ncbi:MAG: Holliday junction branch migration protein RuvA [Lachnospiraceae bacterium]|nr:Holliday junction branch migration protein RuvA [Lachnospiraceae bacterium]
MIGYVKGELVESRNGKIVVEVNGIGYNIIVSDTLREELPSIGNQVKIYTYTSVREDAINLYGFTSRDSLDMFYMLLGVSGVGPKGAQSILSFFNVMDLKYAIISENSTLISKAPTIGKKTAERIVIDLKDKISKEDLLVGANDIGVTSSNKDVPDEAKDAIDALAALGYDKKEATKAILSIEHVEELDTNTILKQALKYLY